MIYIQINDKKKKKKKLGENLKDECTNYKRAFYYIKRNMQYSTSNLMKIKNYKATEF